MAHTPQASRVGDHSLTTTTPYQLGSSAQQLVVLGQCLEHGRRGRLATATNVNLRAGRTPGQVRATLHRRVTAAAAYLTQRCQREANSSQPAEDGQLLRPAQLDCLFKVVVAWKSPTPHPAHNLCHAELSRTTPRHMYLAQAQSTSRDQRPTLQRQAPLRRRRGWPQSPPVLCLGTRCPACVSQPAKHSKAGVSTCRTPYSHRNSPPVAFISLIRRVVLGRAPKCASHGLGSSSQRPHISKALYQRCAVSTPWHHAPTTLRRTSASANHSVKALRATCTDLVSMSEQKLAAKSSCRFNSDGCSVCVTPAGPSEASDTRRTRHEHRPRNGVVPEAAS